MTKLTAANIGSFYIDFGDGVNQPFTRGQVVPRFERNSAGAPTGKIAFEDVRRINELIVPYTSFSNYINGATGNPFGSFNEFVQFTVDYINSIGSTTSIGEVEVTFPSAQPVTISGTPAVSLSGNPGVTPQPTESHLGEVGGNTGIVVATFSRPANTTNYSDGDVVGTSPAAILQFSNAARVNAGSGYITKARVVTSQATNQAAYRLHIYSVAPTAIADNAVNTILFNDAYKRVGYIDFQLPIMGGSGAVGSTGCEALAANIRIAFKCDAGTRHLYGVLETLTAFTPASGQSFYVELSIENN